MNMNSGGEINMKYEDTRAGTDERGIPRVYVKPWRYGLKFFCCYCKHVHRHGTGLGHRVAPVSYTHLTLPTILRV